MRPNERTTTAGNRVGNKILLSIPDKEYALILPHLEFLSMPHHLSLYEPDQPLEFVHFPNTGMVSLVIATEDGRTVEVGEVGREGFAGIQAAVGINRNPVREIVQIAGDGFRVRIDALQSVNSHPEPVSCDLYDLAHWIPVYANRRLYPCKPFPANFPYFNSPSIFRRDYKRHHTGIWKMHKLYRLTRFVETKMVRHSEKF